MPARFKTSAGTPNSRNAAYEIALRPGVALADLHERLLERADVDAARLHAGELDLEVAAALDQLRAGSNRPAVLSD